ncbi:hypothetical protein C7M84_015647 [Penaeus vannamei]|uniref:Uncharacterized protein n=1 Tax=Penaeus vannamei TaxID=6689 RepID=A0A423SQ63_PENVA|nr:hypothetical protein C7M84_015647 [Penaeus vannamei]
MERSGVGSGEKELGYCRQKDDGSLSPRFLGRPRPSLALPLASLAALASSRFLPALAFPVLVRPLASLARPSLPPRSALAIPSPRDLVPRPALAFHHLPLLVARPSLPQRFIVITLSPFVLAALRFPVAGSLTVAGPRSPRRRFLARLAFPLAPSLPLSSPPRSHFASSRRPLRFASPPSVSLRPPFWLPLASRSPRPAEASLAVSTRLSLLLSRPLLAFPSGRSRLRGPPSLSWPDALRFPRPLIASSSAHALYRRARVGPSSRLHRVALSVHRPSFRPRPLLASPCGRRVAFARPIVPSVPASRSLAALAIARFLNHGPRLPLAAHMLPVARPPFTSCTASFPLSRSASLAASHAPLASLVPPSAAHRFPRVARSLFPSPPSAFNPRPPSGFRLARIAFPVPRALAIPRRLPSRTALRSTLLFPRAAPASGWPPSLPCGPPWLPLAPSPRFFPWGSRPQVRDSRPRAAIRAIPLAALELPRRWNMDRSLARPRFSSRPRFTLAPSRYPLASSLGRLRFPRPLLCLSRGRPRFRPARPLPSPASLSRPPSHSLALSHLHRRLAYPSPARSPRPPSLPRRTSRFPLTGLRARRSRFPWAALASRGPPSLPLAARFPRPPPTLPLARRFSRRGFGPPAA